MKNERNRYVHYGHSCFDKELFSTEASSFRTDVLNKPAYGFWGSPAENTFISWKDFCLNEDFHVDSLNEKFFFTISPKAKILKVKALEDAIPYTLNAHPMSRNSCSLYLNWEAIMRDFDGMELTHSRETYDELHFYTFNSWAVDSIVVWNPECIVPE